MMLAAIIAVAILDVLLFLHMIVRVQDVYFWKRAAMSYQEEYFKLLNEVSGRCRVGSSRWSVEPEAQTPPS